MNSCAHIVWQCAEMRLVIQLWMRVVKSNSFLPPWSAWMLVTESVPNSLRLADWLSQGIFCPKNTADLETLEVSGKRCNILMKTV